MHCSLYLQVWRIVILAYKQAPLNSNVCRSKTFVLHYSYRECFSILYSFPWHTVFACVTSSDYRNPPMHSLRAVTEEQLLICCIGNRGDKQIGTIFHPPAVQNAKQNAGCEPGYLQEWAILRRKQIYGMFLNILPNRLHFWEDTDLLTSFWRHVSLKYTMLWYLFGDTFSLLLKTDLPFNSLLYSQIYRF